MGELAVYIGEDGAARYRRVVVLWGAKMTGFGRFARVSVAAAGMLLCADCASTIYRPSDRSAAISTPDDAYFIVGVQPPNFRLRFLALKEGQTENSWDLAPTQLIERPADFGFILVQVHANDRIRITNVIELNSINVRGKIEYQPCGGAPMMAFTVAGETVTYVGSITYLSRNGGVVPSVSNDIEGARAYLKAAHPSLAGRLVQGKIGTVASTEKCGPPER